MRKKTEIKAREWFKKAEHDIKALEIILENSGPADVAGVLLQQGIEKYLKGYLISRGWKLIRTHNLKSLLDEAVRYNKEFSKFYELVTILTGYYFEEKYPFGEAEVTLKEVKDKLKKAQGIIKLVEDI